MGNRIVNVVTFMIANRVSSKTGRLCREHQDPSWRRWRCYQATSPGGREYAISGGLLFTQVDGW